MQAELQEWKREKRQRRPGMGGPRKGNSRERGGRQLEGAYAEVVERVTALKERLAHAAEKKGSRVNVIKPAAEWKEGFKIIPGTEGMVVPEGAVTVNKLREAQKKDAELKRVAKAIQGRKDGGAAGEKAMGKAGRAYEGDVRAGRLFMSGKGIIMRRGQDNGSGLERAAVTVLPAGEPVRAEDKGNKGAASMKMMVMKADHGGPGAAHQSYARTVRRVKERFWWRGMYGDVKKFVGRCEACMMAKNTIKDKRGFQLGMTAVGFLEAVHVDIYGPFPETSAGMRYILTIVEAFSGFADSTLLAEAGSYAVALAMANSFLFRFGVNTIVSDNGNEFINGFFEDVAYLLGSKHVTTALYNPMANSPAERLHRTLRPAITIACNKWGTQRKWDLASIMVVAALNNQRGEGRDELSPNEIMVGVQAKGAMDVIGGPAVDAEPITMERARDKMIMLQEIREVVREAREKSREDNANMTNRKQKPGEEFQKGDRVGRYLHVQSDANAGESAKFKHKMQGPFRVADTTTRGGETRTLRLVSESGSDQVLSMPVRHCFHWRGRKEDRTPTHGSQLMRMAERMAAEPPTENRIPRRGEGRPARGTGGQWSGAGYDGGAAVRDRTAKGWDSAGKFRGSAKEEARLKEIVDPEDKEKTFVLVDTRPRSGEWSYSVARVVEYTWFGGNGLQLLVHLYDTSKGQEKGEINRWSTSAGGGETGGEMMDVKDEYKMTPWWGSMGGAPRAAEKPGEDEMPLEEVVPIGRVVAGPFKARRGALQGLGGRREFRNFVPEQVWKEWKTNKSLQARFKGAIKVEREYKATRTAAAAAEREERERKMRNLTLHEVDNMQVKDLVEQAEKRGMEVRREGGKGGRGVKKKKKELKDMLREWVRSTGNRGAKVG